MRYAVQVTTETERTTYYPEKIDRIKITTRRRKIYMWSETLASLYIYNAGTERVGFHRADRHCLHQARSTVGGRGGEGQRNSEQRLLALELLTAILIPTIAHCVVTVFFMRVQGFENDKCYITGSCDRGNPEIVGVQHLACRTAPTRERSAQTPALNKS